MHRVATGYIGSHTMLALLDAAETPVVIDDLSTGFRSAVSDGVVPVENDSGDGALLEPNIAEHGIDAIAHFGARIVVPESEADPLGYYLDDFARMRNLIEGVRHFITSLTAAVYGKADADLVTEDRPWARRSLGSGSCTMPGRVGVFARRAGDESMDASTAVNFDDFRDCTAIEIPR